MKKVFTAIAIVGGFCILGAAGMADTFNGEQMFARLFAGILCSTIGCAGVYLCKVKAAEREIARRVALIRG